LTYRFVINKLTQIELNRLTEEIDVTFQDFYRAYYDNGELDLGPFWNTTENFLNFIETKQIPFSASAGVECKAAYHDLFFNNLTNVWIKELQNGKYWNALNIWDKILRIVNNWEDVSNKHVHKGTPFYFQSVTCIENEDLDRGFSLMYEGYLEDLIKNNNDDNFDSPGKSFITFNIENQENFYRTKLLEAKTFLEHTFLHLRRRSLVSYNEFSEHFLKNVRITVLIKHQFLLNLFRILKFSKYLPGNSKNSINGLLYMESILGFCRLIEPVYQASHVNTNMLSNKDLFEKLCYRRKNIFDNINVRNFRTDDFRKQLRSILLKKSVRIDGRKHKLSLGTRNILIAYGFRNLTAHELHQEQFIIDHINEILIAIFYSIYRASLL